MSAKLFLGVDGGGTKTGFLIVDESGNTLASRQLGTTHFRQVGLGGLFEVLSEGVTALCVKAGIDKSCIHRAYFGLPGHGEDAAVAQQQIEIVAEVLGHTRFECGNDVVCGWAGSLAGIDGINIVAGTGSIGYGERLGRTARAGGWGDILGDEGSAFWIGIEGLRAFAKMSDGRLPLGPIYELVRQSTHLDRDLDLCALTQSGDRFGGREQIAGFCRLMSVAAADGDSVADAIFRRAADELLAIAVSVREQLAFPAAEPALISFSGGAFAANSPLRGHFSSVLSNSEHLFRLSQPALSPLEGSAILALRAPGTRLDQRVIENLKLSSTLMSGNE
jgi:N-acetylglucosamine kinase-like BadF-type ATPase